MAVIAIAGQIGSGGQDIGQEVANLLEAEFVDTYLLTEAANRTGMSREEWDARDMRVDSLADRVARLFQTFIQRSAASYTADPYMSGEPLLSRTYEQAAAQPSNEEQTLDDQRFLEVTTEIIQELARLPRVVIIGRGATYILKDNPRVFNVLALAPRDVRIRRYAERASMSVDEVRKDVDDQEQHRQAFLRKFFGVDPFDPSWFDMVLRVDRLEIKHYAQMVATGARALDEQLQCDDT